MKNKGFGFLFLLLGCEPGKVGETNDEAIYFEWEEGDDAPRIAQGHIYCEFDAAEFYVFYISVLADDPQGASDIKEGVWRGYSDDSSSVLVEDVLICDGNDCVYSFHADQYPQIPCELLQDFRFEAEIFDWQQNSTGVFDLQVLDSAPSN